jgi:hypothetical protein
MSWVVVVEVTSTVVGSAFSLQKAAVVETPTCFLSSE